jgi:hypothetical protein
VPDSANPKPEAIAAPVAQTVAVDSFAGADNPIDSVAQHASSMASGKLDA